MNGLILSGKYIPQEVVGLILSFVPWRSLLACRAVCTVWRYLIDQAVSDMKVKNEFSRLYFSSFINQTIPKHQKVPFFLKYAISQNAFGTNLLSNFFGTSRNIPVMWKVTLSCFGLNAKIMDEVQPHLEIFIWYSSYIPTNSIKISLLDREGECIFYYFCKSTSEEDGSEWQRVFYTFKNYGPGVRYVQFQHGRWDAVGGERYCLRSSYKIANLGLTALIPSSGLHEEDDRDNQWDT